MLKNKSKLFVLVIAFILLLTTVSFATAENTLVNEVTNEATTTSEENHDENAITEDDIYSGDLYLFDNDVVMDKLVDGNVFIMGQNVEITGKVNGSLYVLANNVSISENSYIVHALYVCANNLTLKGAANDLYACCTKVDMPTNSFIIRDLRVAAETFNFAGGVGRDAFVSANDFTFASDEENAAIVYGNLTYNSTNELTLTKELVNGNINYNKLVLDEEEASISEIITDKLVDLCRALIYTAVIFLLIIWIAPNFAKKASSYVGKESLKCFGIGILGFIAAILGCFILLITYVGIPIAISAFILFALMIAISFAITAICITYKVKEKYDLKDAKFALALILVTLILWLLELIPYLGTVVTIIISLYGFGVIVAYLFSKGKKVKKEETTIKENK